MIHETLYMGWGIPEVYQDNCRMFETMMTDDYKMVMMIWINEELEKEACDIDNCEKALSSYCFDNILL